MNLHDFSYKEIYDALEQYAPDCLSQLRNSGIVTVDDIHALVISMTRQDNSMIKLSTLFSPLYSYLQGDDNIFILVGGPYNYKLFQCNYEYILGSVDLQAFNIAMTKYTKEVYNEEFEWVPINLH